MFEPGLGELKAVEVKLEVDHSVPPRFFRPRSLPYVYREKVEQQLEQDVKAGILVPVHNSQWAASLVPMLKKKSGEIRVCANFKLTANRAVKLDQYPLPLVEDIFAQLAGGVIFSKIDLAQAYNQIAIHKDSRDILTIKHSKRAYVICSSAVRNLCRAKHISARDRESAERHAVCRRISR